MRIFWWDPEHQRFSETCVCLILISGFIVSHIACCLIAIVFLQGLVKQENRTRLDFLWVLRTKAN